MSGSEQLNKMDECGCSTVSDAPSPPQKGSSSVVLLESSLRNLIPVAVVIVGGCERCAEVIVARALEQGSSTEDLVTVLRIIARMREVECIVEAFGHEAIARMEKPLATAHRILKEGVVRVGQ